jgi:Flp pilus assembly protein TadG
MLGFRFQRIKWPRIGDVLQLVSAFAAAKRGATAVTLALSLPVIVGTAGFAVDYAAVNSTQNRLQAMVDSAALAVAREMTLVTLTADRVQSVAAQYVAANIPANTPYPIDVVAVLAENNMAVEVKGTQQVVTPFGFLEQLAGVAKVSATALARVTAANTQTKLCMLSLGEDRMGGIFMHNGSTVTAPECAIYSNSSDKDAVIIQNGSTIRAKTICAHGGVKNLSGMVDATTVTDCPIVRDPLAAKAEPPTNAPCDHTLTVVLFGTKTLNPGTYCNGVYVLLNARVVMNPGIYVFRDGPFLAAMNAEVTGAGVSLVMTGKYAMLRLHGNALVELSAPTSGAAAGMLVWEAKSWVPGTNSWKMGGCGSEPSGSTNNPTTATPPAGDSGPTGCTSIQAYVTRLMKKTNEHQINADRAKTLTGTIYMPKGLLLIDSRKPVADQSPFTILVVNKLDLYDGPNLVLNANYNGSTIPVPAGLGPLGASQLRLGY